MSHYIVASYPSADRAAGVVTELVGDGVPRDAIGVLTEESAPDSIERSLAALGAPEDEARSLAARVGEGQLLVGVTTPSIAVAARIQSVMQRFEPSHPVSAYVGGATTALPG